MVFKLHRVKVRRKVEHLGLCEFADFHRIVQVEAGHNALAGKRADAKEGFQRAL